MDVSAAVVGFELSFIKSELIFLLKFEEDEVLTFKLRVKFEFILILSLMLAVYGPLIWALSKHADFRGLKSKAELSSSVVKLIHLPGHCCDRCTAEKTLWCLRSF